MTDEVENGRVTDTFGADPDKAYYNNMSVDYTTSGEVHFRTKHDPVAIRALSAAIVSSRRAPLAPLRGQRRGDCDSSRVARLSMKDLRVFTRNSAPAPSRLRVAVLLDGSGSMSGPRAAQTMQLGRDLAGAMSTIKNITATIYGHTTHVLNDAMRDEAGNELPDSVISVLWNTGEPLDYVDDYGQSWGGGNADGYAIQWVGDRLMESMKPGEAGLIIVASDGDPTYWNVEHDRKAHAYNHVANVAKSLRDKRIGVVGVSMAAGLRYGRQVAMYGRENVVEFNPNVVVLARSLAKVIGKAL